MNNLNFTGRIGNDAEVKSTQGGTTVCEFSAAMKSGYGDKEHTTWVKCVMFGKRAEGGLVQYLVKGQEIAVSGEAKLETWDNNGKTGAALKCSVNQVTLVGGKQERQQSAQAPQAPNLQSPQTPQGDHNSFDDDIPF
jgi:single-strand DNA-binding protein